MSGREMYQDIDEGENGVAAVQPQQSGFNRAVKLIVVGVTVSLLALLAIASTNTGSSTHSSTTSSSKMVSAEEKTPVLISTKASGSYKYQGKRFSALPHDEQRSMFEDFRNTFNRKVI